MTKQVIAVDIDDVLADSAQAWVNYANKQWGTNLAVEDYDENWAKMWGVDHETSVKRANQVYKSGVVSTFLPKETAYITLKKLAERFTLVIATSRVQKVEVDTLDWVEQHYGGIFSGVHLAGIFDTLQEASYTATKADLIRQIGADYLIDDQPKHCFAVAEAGIEAVLFGSYPWSTGVVLPEGVTRCKDWVAVLEYFDARS